MFGNPERRGQEIAVKYDAAIASLEPEAFRLLVRMVHETAHIFTDTDCNTRTKEDSEKMFVAMVEEMRKYNEF